METSFDAEKRQVLLLLHVGREGNLPDKEIKTFIPDFPDWSFSSFKLVKTIVACRPHHEKTTWP